MQVMNLQHVNVKIFFEDTLEIDPGQFIEVFHRWIQEKVFEELLIDVADYRHVPMGPAVMLIGLEADYVIDNAKNRCGLLYNRKAPLDGGNADRFQQALRAAAGACLKLESEFESDGSLKFNRREFELIINDRALAPNSSETFAACQEELNTFLNSTLGHDEFHIEHLSDPRSRFGVSIKVGQAGLDLNALTA